ncbi:hypothetical protein Aduo_004932 [Ancylostoma duodenale]
MGSVEKVDFIEQCIYKYYQVEVESRASVWRSAKTALNARARRVRRNHAAEALITQSTQGSTSKPRQHHGTYSMMINMRSKNGFCTRVMYLYILDLIRLLFVLKMGTRSITCPVVCMPNQ